MKLLIKYIGCGKIYKKGSEKQVVELIISKFSDIINIIIPLFTNNSLHGIKQLNFIDFCKVAKLMSKGSHLTQEGFNLISTIKSRMNKGREI
jgi:LAGLIDADG endonuclease